MKIELISQKREMLLFLTSNMAAVTSRANQQYKTARYFLKNVIFSRLTVFLSFKIIDIL